MSLRNSHTSGQRKGSMRNCLEGCVDATKSTELWCENWGLRTRVKRGDWPRWSRRLPPAYQVVGRKQRQERRSSKEIPSLWVQGRSPSRHQREKHSLLRKGTWLSRQGMGRGRAFSGHTTLPAGSMFPGELSLQSLSRSGSWLIGRSSNLPANFSRSEEGLAQASELWGKAPKLPDLSYFWKLRKRSIS